MSIKDDTGVMLTQRSCNNLLLVVMFQYGDKKNLLSVSRLNIINTHYSQHFEKDVKADNLKKILKNQITKSSYH